MPGSTPRTSCRICGAAITEFLNFGDMPLANGLLDSPDQPESRYPLRAMFCASCGLVQLGDVVDPALMFNPAYAFKTSSSAKMVEHFAKLFEDHPAQSVVEIGGNDSAGWLASKASENENIEYINIDPAGVRSPHQWSIVPTGERFTEHLARRIEARDGPAGLIVACNVLGHVDDLHDFMRGVKALLHPGGSFVFEVPYLAHTIANVDYAQFYHEHLSYFSLAPLTVLMEKHGMGIVKVEDFPVHGGSIRCTVKHGGVMPDDVRKRISCTEHYGHSLFSLARMQRFASAAQSKRDTLRERVSKLRADDKRIIGYCASAKGAVVLNWAGIGRYLVPWIIDSTPGKLHKWMPGTHQLVVPEGSLNHYDAILLLSPNHLDEIRAKNTDFRGEWITP